MLQGSSLTGVVWTVALAASVVQAGPTDAEIAALIFKESSGNDRAIGDKELKDKAYGPLQIRQPVITDVNQHYGTNYRPEQMLGNRALSIEVAKKYWAIYATEKRLGRPVTAVDRAGIWNGGPHGWKRTATARYRRDFQAIMACQKAGKPLAEWRKFLPSHPTKKSSSRKK